MLSDTVINNLITCCGTGVLADNVFKSLVENVMLVFRNSSHKADLKSIYGSKPDVIKATYAALLDATAQLYRVGCSKDEAQKILTEQCKFPIGRATTFANLFAANEVFARIALSNIGTHPEHIVDIKWSIDYLITASNLSAAEGPIFRITLVLEQFDEIQDKSVRRDLKFNCNNLELQDLVYNLKSATVHCQKFLSEHH